MVSPSLVISDRLLTPLKIILILYHVALPTMPSDARLKMLWNARTAASVSAPNTLDTSLMRGMAG